MLLGGPKGSLGGELTNVELVDGCVLGPIGVLHVFFAVCLFGAASNIGKKWLGIQGGGNKMRDFA